MHLFVLAPHFAIIALLVAPTKEDAGWWISGLHMLMAQIDFGGDDPSKLSQNMGTWLRKKWIEADTSGDGTLDLDEVTALMKKLNIRLSKSELKSTFKVVAHRNTLSLMMPILTLIRAYSDGWC